jgi:hypothetical protein
MLSERTGGCGWKLLAEIEAAYERGEIDAAEGHRRVGAIFGPAACVSDVPRRGWH